MSKDRALSSTGRFLWSVGPPLGRLLGRLVYSLRIESTPDLPDGPVVIAANHFSHLDPPLVATAFDRPIRYLAVDELAGNSFLMDRVLDWFGTVPVPRGRVPLGAMRTSLELLDHGHTVGVFPEGARVRQWGERTPKRGAAWLAVRAGVPMVPVVIKGTDRAFDIDNNWHRAKVEIVVGEPLQGGNVDDIISSWETWVGSQMSGSTEPG